MPRGYCERASTSAHVCHRTLFKAFELEQAQGEKLNELTERYYKRYPRGFDDPWPCPQYQETDTVLRKFLTEWTELKPAEIAKLAKQELGIDLDS